MREQSEQKLLRSYSRPKLRVVELATKEVLAVGCKTTTGTAVGGAFPPCWSNSCQNDGS